MNFQILMKGLLIIFFIFQFFGCYFSDPAQSVLFPKNEKDNNSLIAAAMASIHQGELTDVELEFYNQEDQLMTNIEVLTEEEMDALENVPPNESFLNSSEPNTNKKAIQPNPNIQVFGDNKEKVRILFLANGLDYGYYVRSLDSNNTTDVTKQSSRSSYEPKLTWVRGSDITFFEINGKDPNKVEAKGQPGGAQPKVLNKKQIEDWSRRAVPPSTLNTIFVPGLIRRQIELILPRNAKDGIFVYTTNNTEPVCFNPDRKLARNGTIYTGPFELVYPTTLRIITCIQGYHNGTQSIFQYTPEYVGSIGGYATGLTSSGLVLQNNGKFDYLVELKNPNGPNTYWFSFRGGKGQIQLDYDITVKTQPAGLTCTVTDGKGQATAKEDIASVKVTCAPALPTLPSPTFNPPEGNYSTTQTVSIASPTSGAKIRYTINGGDPACKDGIVYTVGKDYSAPVNVPSTTTIKAIACTAGESSEIVTATYTLPSPITCEKCRMFFTNERYDGNLGGVAGADAKCQSASNKPASGTYKAFIVDGTNRVSCSSTSCFERGTSEHVDWVIKPNTEYIRPDGTLITKSSPVGLLPNSILINNISATSSSGWTGLTFLGDVFTQYTCNNWTSNSSNLRGAMNRESSIHYSNIIDCSYAYNRILCVEQSTPTYNIGGTVSGLTASGLVLQNNAGDDQTVASGASSFTFTSTGSYAVTVKTQPTGLNCTVSNGSGTATANVTNVSVSCTVIQTYSIGGTVTGLTASGLVLQNNAGNDLTVSSGANSFTFSTQVTGTYAVTVKTQPTGMSCTVSNGSGTATANVTNVGVSCAGACLGTTVTRSWGTFTDCNNGTIKFEGTAGTFGGQTYTAQTLYFAKCTHGQTYNASANDCTGTGDAGNNYGATQVQYCNANANSCNGTDTGTLNGSGTSSAYTACNGLSLAGKAWRVTTNNEFRLTINCSDTTILPSNMANCPSNDPPDIPIFPPVEEAPYVIPLFTTVADNYWTSTSETADSARRVDPRSGSFGTWGKTNNFYVRCVSGP
ncbi:MAG: DUF1554 domain-containing protein [Leptospiraceae bacterium]|nr:DUF1554 domain-containing protein [Leptospiraceae bacterium]